MEERYATELPAGSSRGVGYLLKDRVAEVREFVDAVVRVAQGGTALDPEGRVFFQGAYWDAISQIPVAKGAKVRIVAADRLKLVVEPLAVEV